MKYKLRKARPVEAIRLPAPVVTEDGNRYEAGDYLVVSGADSWYEKATLFESRYEPIQRPGRRPGTGRPPGRPRKTSLFVNEVSEAQAG